MSEELNELLEKIRNLVDSLGNTLDFLQPTIKDLNQRTLDDQKEGFEQIRELINEPPANLSVDAQTKLNDIYQNIAENLIQYCENFNEEWRYMRNQLKGLLVELFGIAFVEEYSQNRLGAAESIAEAESIREARIKLRDIESRVKNFIEVAQNCSNYIKLLSEPYSLKLIHDFATNETNDAEIYGMPELFPQSIIHYAASHRMPNTVDLLLQLGANPKHQINPGRTADLLLQLVANSNHQIIPGRNESYTPLDIALNPARPHNTENEFQATVEVIRKFAEHNALHSADGKAPVRGTNYRALHHLAEEKEWDIVERIIQLTDNEDYLAHTLSININRALGNQKFDTLFHIAARQDNVDAANFLLSIARGIDSQTMHEFCDDSHFLAIENGDGETPLSIAQQSNSEVARLFNEFVSEYTASQENDGPGVALSSSRHSVVSAPTTDNASAQANEGDLQPNAASSRSNNSNKRCSIM